MIKLEHIIKIYNEKVDDTKALDDVSLTINDGELVAIMGPSGSGKSTLLNIIGCMDTVTSGSYKLDSEVISSMNKREMDRFRKNNIGFIFQHFALMDYYNAYENIELPLLAHNINKNERKKTIVKVMERLKILQIKSKKPSKMSGGQQQRVAIARALVSGCGIILADEPTGALDCATGKEVMKLLKQINEEGKTVIIVTHDENIANMTDRIINITDGKIVEDRSINNMQ